MAKRKTATAGPSTGLIVTLIFFILTTFVAGTLAYFGYSDQEKFKKEAADAKAKATEATNLANKREALYYTYKMVFGNLGSGSDQAERGAFADKLNTFGQEIRTEVDSITPTLANAGFGWPTGQDGKLAPEPTKSIAALVGELKTLTENATKARDQAEQERQKAETAFLTKEKNLKQTITNLEKEKGRLENDKMDAEKRKIAEFEGLVKSLAEKGKQLDDKTAEAAQKAEDDRRLIALREKTIADLETKIRGYESRVVIGADLVEKDTKKGEIEKVEGEYVFINRGSADLLRPQTTFSVLPPDAVWRNSDEKSRLVKGELEVIEILGPNAARAKIVGQRNAIRDPIRVRDQLFNIAWTPGLREHIAFAGIIDLNGDGVDDNKAFVQLIEKQGVVIDQYLDLDTRSVKGAGMTISTKFLVLGPEVVLPADYGRRFKANDPRLLAMQDIQAKMNQMKVDAAKLGIQVIEYRKFLVSIGVKVPEKVAPANYDSMQYTKKEDREAMQKENDK